MMRFSEQSQTIAPAALPVSLEINRVDARHLLALVGLALLLLVIAGMAVGIMIVWPLVALAGLLIVVAAVSLAGLLVWLVAAEVQARIRYHALINEWHYAAMERYQSGAADSVASTSTEWELSVNNPAHTLIVALHLHQMIELGGTPSVRMIEGPMFLAGRRIGDLSRDQAQLVLARLAGAGLIEGRGPRVAGRWVATSADQIVQALLSQKWG